MINLTFLGSGSSMGIPQIGCTCNVCLSSDNRDNRTRTGIWLRSLNHSLIIDVSNDFRQQALKNKIDTVDTICISHLHSDHFLGLDDMRAFKRSINIYINPNDWENFHYRYDYAINKTYSNIIRPQFIPHKANNNMSINCQDFTITPFPVNHGKYDIRGFLIKLPNLKRFAFITDCKTLSPKVIKQLYGIDYLALACIWQNHHQHPSHLTLKEATKLISTLNANETWLFHISHKMGKHQEVETNLPNNIQLAYDGLKIILK